MSKKLVRHALCFLMLTLLFAPVVVLAQFENFGEEYIENINVPQEETDIGTIVTNVINWVLGFLALIAIIIILVAGFEWMTAGGNEDKVKRAQTRLKYGLIGLVIIFLAYAIVMFVFRQITEWT